MLIGLNYTIGTGYFRVAFNLSNHLANDHNISIIKMIKRIKAATIISLEVNSFRGHKQGHALIIEASAIVEAVMQNSRAN